VCDTVGAAAGADDLVEHLARGEAINLHQVGSRRRVRQWRRGPAPRHGR
jgi:hypothetical protein